MTSSMNLVTIPETLRSFSQSTSFLPFVVFIKKVKNILPKLQESKGYSGCSPQGLVDSIGPNDGTGLAEPEFILSIKITPGSPALHAPPVISSNTFPASSFPTTSLVFG